MASAPGDDSSNDPDWPPLTGAATDALRVAARELEAAQLEAVRRFIEELTRAQDRMRQRLATVALGFDLTPEEAEDEGDPPGGAGPDSGRTIRTR